MHSSHQLQRKKNDEVTVASLVQCPDKSRSHYRLTWLVMFESAPSLAAPLFPQTYAGNSRSKLDRFIDILAIGQNEAANLFPRLCERTIRNQQSPLRTRTILAAFTASNARAAIKC